MNENCVKETINSPPNRYKAVKNVRKKTLTESSHNLTVVKTIINITKSPLFSTL